MPRLRLTSQERGGGALDRKGPSHNYRSIRSVVPSEALQLLRKLELRLSLGQDPAFSGAANNLTDVCHESSPDRQDSAGVRSVLPSSEIGILSRG